MLELALREVSILMAIALVLEAKSLLELKLLLVLTVMVCLQILVPQVHVLPLVVLAVAVNLLALFARATYASSTLPKSGTVKFFEINIPRKSSSVFLDVHVI